MGNAREVRQEKSKKRINVSVNAIGKNVLIDTKLERKILPVFSLSRRVFFLYHDCRERNSEGTNSFVLHVI